MIDERDLMLANMAMPRATVSWAALEGREALICFSNFWMSFPESTTPRNGSDRIPMTCSPPNAPKNLKIQAINLNFPVLKDLLRCSLYRANKVVNVAFSFGKWRSPFHCAKILPHSCRFSLSFQPPHVLDDLVGNSFPQVAVAW